MIYEQLNTEIVWYKIWHCIVIVFNDKIYFSNALEQMNCYFYTIFHGMCVTSSLSWPHFCGDKNWGHFQLLQRSQNSTPLLHGMVLGSTQGKT